MKKPKANYDIQGALVDYLNTGVDAWDFFFVYFEDFASYAEIPNPEKYKFPDEVPPEMMSRFKKWIEEREVAVDWVAEDPHGSPAYLTISDARRLPRGSWLVHFTEASGIKEFLYGATIENLHLSRLSPKKKEADCEENLSSEIGLFEVVWGFAYGAMTYEWPRMFQMGSTHSAKRWGYGRNALFFQCDYAVEAMHWGDEQKQAIFPLCSEYNVIFAEDVGENEINVETKGGEILTFPGHEELIAYARERSKRDPSMRLAGLGSLWR